MSEAIDMTAASGRDDVRIMTLQSHILAEQDPHTHAGGTFSWIMSALSISAKIISDKVRRARLENVLGSVGAENVQGEVQQKLDVLANDVDFAPTGWTMTFVDASDNGHDKAAHVLAARARGSHTVYIGDGVSDFAAAAVADERFAKAGRALEAYCRERGIACTPFTSFSEIERRLFPSA